MKQKKKSANWYIAATHYLTAGFAIPFIVRIVAAFTVVPIIVSVGSDLLSFGASLGIGILALWLGIMYSARYLRNKYIIENKMAIVNYSLVYFLVLSGGFYSVQILSGAIEGTTILYRTVQFAAGVAVFYIASKKYITETTEIPENTTQNSAIQPNNLPPSQNNSQT